MTKQDVKIKSFSIDELLTKYTDWKLSGQRYGNKIIFNKINPFYTIEVLDKQSRIFLKHNTNLVIKEYIFYKKPLSKSENDKNVYGYFPVGYIFNLAENKNNATLIKNTLQYNIFMIINLFHHWSYFSLFGLISFDREINKETLKKAIDKMESFFIENGIKILDPKEDFKEIEKYHTMEEKYSAWGRKSYSKTHGKLRDKVKELCNELMKRDKQKPQSAEDLKKGVIKILEKEHKDLLLTFTSYCKHLRDTSHDWTKPTFYDWCNTIYKKYKNNK